MNNKKVYMVHGWGGNVQEGWFPWIKKELEKRGVEVHTFNMPHTDYPVIKEWVEFLKKNIKNINEETYFIGHSIGTQTVLRFLEKLPTNLKIGGGIFIAGWFNLKEETYDDDEDKEIIRPWIETPIDFEKVKNHCDNFLSIFSDNDPFVSFSDSDIFKNKLEAKIIIEKHRGHFIEEKEPIILKETLKFLKLK